jgi:hypothetical protein
MGLWRVSYQKVEWSFLCCCIGPGVSSVLGEGEPCVPGVLFGAAEEPKVLFQGLICSFALSICLGVECHADVLVYLQDVTNFFGCLGCETGVSVTDDFFGDAVVWEDVLYVCVCNGPCVCCLVNGDKECGFGTIVIGDGEDAVISS